MSTTSPNITDPVTIVEVSPRDGLQNESALVYSDHKLALIGHLVTMGAKRVEVVSFVNPRRGTRRRPCHRHAGQSAPAG